MLPDRVYQVLTSAVDGELSGREQHALDKLLRESAEAREIYRKLKNDSDAIKNLPQEKLPPNFGTQVVEKLNPIIQSSTTIRPGGLSRRLPMWANLAAAAAVLMAISLGTYAVMVLTEKEEQNVVKNQQQPTNLSPSPSPPNVPSIAHHDSNNDKKKDPEQLPIPPIEVVDASRTETPKAVEAGNPDVLTANPKPSFDKLFTVEDKLPPILAVRDLDQNGARQKLLAVLKKNDGVHLDLFCRDTNRAFDRLQAAFKGQKLLIDAVAQERLQRKLKTHYVFYTESLTPDEIHTILRTLAVEERKADAKKEGQFDQLVANPLSPNSVKTLSMLLGVDPKWLQSKPKAAAPIDPTKPLSDSTADSLAKSLKGGPSSLRAEPLVLVLPYNPIRPVPLASKEVRQFLESAGKVRRPGTIPLLLVLRTAEN